MSQVIAVKVQVYKVVAVADVVVSVVPDRDVPLCLVMKNAREQAIKLVREGTYQLKPFRPDVTVLTAVEVSRSLSTLEELAGTANFGDVTVRTYADTPVQPVRPSIVRPEEEQEGGATDASEDSPV